MNVRSVYFHHCISHVHWFRIFNKNKKLRYLRKRTFHKTVDCYAFGRLYFGNFIVIHVPFVEVQRNFFGAIFKIGLIEEFSKLLALMVVYYFIKKEFNEIVDGIIYITAISLGFAILENISYSLSSEDPFTLLFHRSVFSVLGHISFSGYMGISFYIHKKIRKNYLGIGLSVLLAALAHGFYDGVIFHPELNFLFNFIFIALIFLQFWFLKTALGFSEFWGLLMARWMMYPLLATVAGNSAAVRKHLSQQ
ncbi:MAG: PrsW family intramembrane metalloprotease [Bacteroidales bacterium]|nr:PrsW family intramembrane metalloprotease [Bacteroidales bacterium]